MIQFGPVRHERKSVSETVGKCFLETKLKHRERNCLFPLDVSVMFGSVGASLGPQRGLRSMKPTDLEEGTAKSGQDITHTQWSIIQP